MVTKLRPGTVLGTMEFGRGPCNVNVAKEMTESFLNYDTSFRQLDTALMYSGGKSEKIIGEMSSWREVDGLIDDKINPWDKKDFGEESIRSQVDTILKNLATPCVNILYLHAPDHNTPLETTLRTMNTLHQEGKFKKLGLSNYSSWLVSEVVNVCKANNFVLPTVYQGMYSLITRQVEEELIPCLRYHGISFYAYSPLGGGLLTGKYDFNQQNDKKIPKGRFNGVGWDKVYRDRYWKEEHFKAMETLKELLEKHHPDEKITIPEAAFRWIYNHSLLEGEKGDAVVLGASRMDQVTFNLKMSKSEPLHSDVVSFMDDWWKSTKHLCPQYFR